MELSTSHGVVAWGAAKHTGMVHVCCPSGFTVDQLQHTFETSDNPQIQEDALHLLAVFRNPELQRRSLEFAVSGKVRKQDAIFQLLIPMQSPQTRGIAWDFIRNNWDKVKAQITTAMGG